MARAEFGDPLNTRESLKLSSFALPTCFEGTDWALDPRPWLWSEMYQMVLTFNSKERISRTENCGSLRRLWLHRKFGGHEISCPNAR